MCFRCTTENGYGKAVISLTLDVTDNSVQPRNTSSKSSVKTKLGINLLINLI